MNHVELMGAMPAPPDLRYTPGGLAICEVTLAAADENGRKWYQRATVFGKMGEIIADLDAGHVLYLAGRLDYQTWDGQDGEKRSALKVVANDTRTLGDSFPTEPDKRGQPVLTRGLNRVVVSGNATRDAEARDTSNGSSVVNVGVAVNDYRKGEQVTHFVDLGAWGDQDAFSPLSLVRKGDGIVATGAITSRSWEAEDGTRKYRTEVSCREAYLVVKDSTPARGQPAAAPASSKRLDIDEVAAFDPADLPF